MGKRLDVVTFGPRRRAHRMMRQLRKLDAHDATLRAAGIDPLDEWHRSRHPRGASTTNLAATRARRRPIVLALVVSASETGLVAWQYYDSPASSHPVVVRPDTLPPAGVDERSVRIGQPEPAPAGHGGYRLENTQADGTTPVGWDPCRPIHYVISGSAPVGASRTITSALAEVSRVTGFAFVADGTTSERAEPKRAPYQPQRYGRRWAPVLIAWTSPRRVPRLTGDAIGLGGAAEVSFGGSARTYVSGVVYLDKPQFRAALRQARQPARTRAELRAVVLHEVGHLLGLAHVRNRSAVMYPETNLAVTDYSPGDRRGLHAVSEGRCAPQL